MGTAAPTEPAIGQPGRLVIGVGEPGAVVRVELDTTPLEDGEVNPPSVFVRIDAPEVYGDQRGDFAGALSARTFDHLITALIEARDRARREGLLSA